MKILIATEKTFAPVAIEGIREVIAGTGHELAILEKYTDRRQLLEAVADADAFMAEFPGRVFFTPKKMGAQTAEANINAGIAAARQIVDFFATGSAPFRVNK